MHSWLKAGVASLLAMGLMVAHSYAQTDPATGSTRPQQALEEPPVPKSVPKRTVPLIQEQMTPESAAEVSFIFRELRIEGAVTIPEEMLRAAWPHEPGSVIAVKEVFRLANAVTRAYARAGYALSFGLVPEQQIENGIVTVRVVEGFVDNIEFFGKHADTLKGTAMGRKAGRIAAGILNSRPLRTVDLERYLLLVGDLPGLKVAATLMPAPTALGGSTLRIAVTERHRTQAQLAYNNFLPESLGRDTAGGWIQANGLITGADIIRLGGWRSLDSDQYWSASGDVSTMIGSEGLTIGLSGFYSKSDPDEDFLSSLEYLGKTTFASIHTSYPVIRTRSRNLIIGASAALLNTESEILGSDLTRDKLRTLEAFATYDFADHTGSVNYLRISVAQGLDVLNASGNSRANGDVEYTTTTLDAQTNRPLLATPIGTLAMRLQLRGQATVGSNAVFSAAECGYGGRQFGRGFEPSIMLGDHCVLGLAELSWSRPVGASVFDIYAFADAGITFQKGTLVVDEARDRTASSAGTGIRLRFADRISGVLEAAWPMKKPTNDEQIDDFRFNAFLRIGF